MQILDVSNTFGLYRSTVSLRTLFVCAVACLSASPRGGGDCPVVRAMPKAAAWTSVQVKTETVIRGGVGRKQNILNIERFEFEDREASFVHVSPNDGWLCKVVAGIAPGLQQFECKGILWRRLRPQLGATCTWPAATQVQRPFFRAPVV